jgi:prophage regulatory protein
MTLSRFRILRTNELAEMLGVSRVTLWRWERQGLLPAKRRLGPNTVGWLASEIEAWLASTAPAVTDGTDPVVDSEEAT